MIFDPIYLLASMALMLCLLSTGNPRCKKSYCQWADHTDQNKHRHSDMEHTFQSRITGALFFLDKQM